MRLVDSFYVGSTSIEVALASITDADVEVVVNSICDLLHFGSGVSGAITRAGGRDIEGATIGAAVGHNVTPGDVIVTGAGRMQFRYVFHAISSSCRNGTTAEILRRCAVNCLSEARSRKVGSIALPALGTGEMGFDTREAAAILIDTVVSDCASTPGLDRVVFCLLRPDAFTAFFRHAVRRSIALEAGSASDKNDHRSLRGSLATGATRTDALVKRLHRETNGARRARLVIDALARFLVPPLSAPRALGTSDDNAQYHESVFPNLAAQGFWHLLDERFGASVIRVVCPIQDGEDLDAGVAHMRDRLRAFDSGRVGIVVGRDSGDREFGQVALDAHRKDGALILTLDDFDLSQMCDLQQAGQPIETYLEAKVSALSVASAESELSPTANQESVPRKVFVSYAHEDAEHQRRLAKNLRLMHVQGLIAPWSDCALLPGSSWEDEIREKLDEADFVVCLVSPDFIASEFCFCTELGRALQRHSAGAALVVPIVIRPCEWDQTPLRTLQAMPLDSNGDLVAVTRWDDADTAWLQVARQFRRLLSEGTP